MVVLGLAVLPVSRENQVLASLGGEVQPGRGPPHGPPIYLIWLVLLVKLLVNLLILVSS